MNAALAALGWSMALVGCAATWALHTRLARRSELVVRAAHELRGPLTAVRLGVHLVSRTEGPQRGTLRAIDLELSRAGLALDDLTASSRGRRAPDRHDLVDVRALLEDVAAAWQPVAQALGAELRVQPPCRHVVVRGDRVRLAQACGNLVANAIEHGGGRIELRARLEAECVRVEVSDDGPGLPATVARLQRSPRSGRGRRGRGLAIAGEIAARHGGRLASAPSPSGARLALELPTGAALT